MSESDICKHTTEDVIHCVKYGVHSFHFINCLHKDDQTSFIDAYVRILNSDPSQLKYYEKGVIKVSTWLSIMRSFEVHSCYRIYRNTYWGENTGHHKIDSKKEPIEDTLCKSMLVELGDQHVHTIDLLISNRNIAQIYLFRNCPFIDMKQWFWDRIIQ